MRGYTGGLGQAIAAGEVRRRLEAATLRPNCWDLKKAGVWGQLL